MGLALVVAYDGRLFAGAAVQPSLPTVAGRLEGALATVLQRSVRLRLAGRTDAGVHARAQVLVTATDDGERQQLGSGPRLARRLERLAGPGIWVRAAHVGDGEVDLRRVVRWRHYRYELLARQGTEVPPWSERRWAVGSLDVHTLAGVLATLRGELDATGLCRAHADGGYRRRIFSTRVWIRPQGVIEVSVVGASCCHELVRRAVGNAVAVAQGRLSAAAFVEALGAGDRATLRFVAPPGGLTLWRIGFDEHWEWSEERLALLGAERDSLELDSREEPASWWDALASGAP